MKLNYDLKVVKSLLRNLLEIENLSKQDIRYLKLESRIIKLSNKLNNLDQERLFLILYRHRLIEFFYENKFFKRHIKNIHKNLEKPYKVTFFSNLKNLIQIQKILKVFEENNINVIVIKGITLSLLTKNNYTSRISSDLDLFISSNDLFDSIEILQNHGYKISHRFLIPKSTNLKRKIFKQFAYEINLKNDSNQLLDIDLHWKLSIYSSNLPKFKDAWNRSIILKKNNLKLRSLNKSDALINICAHASKDKWMCLGNLLEIHFFIKKLSNKELEQLYKIREVKNGIFATYLLTKESYYGKLILPKKIDQLYIRKISHFFQKLPHSFKGLDNDNFLINLISIFHEYYLSNDFGDKFQFLIRLISKLIPNKLIKIIS